MCKNNFLLVFDQFLGWLFVGGWVFFVCFELVGIFCDVPLVITVSGPLMVRAQDGKKPSF